MKKVEPKLNEQIVHDLTIEVIAKSIMKETSKSGFTKAEYIRLINKLLDISLEEISQKNEDFADIRSKLGKKKLNMPTKGEKISIRLFDKIQDKNLLDEWVKEEEGRYFLLSQTDSKNLILGDLLASEFNKFGIITLPDSTPIGILGFLNIDYIFKKAEMRKLIGDKNFRGKGYAKEATKLWIQYGIANLDLKKIYINTLEANIKNINLNEELGFKIEGILRKECLIDGNYYDLLRMSLITEED